MTEDRNDEPKPEPLPVNNAELGGLLRCTRCGLNYASAKSTSALRLTYCSFLCELGDLGFSMAGLEHMQRKPRVTETAPPEPVPAA
jgi:hypothetical protein